MPVTNFALASQGSTATASSEYLAGGPNVYNPHPRVIDGYRHTNNNWGTTNPSGGGWNSANGPTTGAPEWVVIDFNASRTISEIDVFHLANAINYTTNPTLSDIATLYQAIDYKLQYWNGSAWVDIAVVTGNTHVWNQFTFSPITTTKIRFIVTSSGNTYARLVEIEAWGDNALTFQRPYSNFIATYLADKATLNSRAYNTELAIEITLQDTTVLPYATADLNITYLSQGTSSTAITPKAFVARIQAKPEIKHTQTAAVDLTGLTLVNLDYILSQLIPDSMRPFDNASIRVYLCFPRGGGNYEGLIYFDGKLVDVAGNDDEAMLSIESDVASKLALVGRPITQRCLNELGDAFCGVGFLPGGAVCTKIFEDKVSGCAYWQGVFQGVPYIAPSSAVPGYNGPTGGDDNGGGWDEPHDGCPDLAMWFKSANGGFIQGRDLREGEAILWNDIPVIVTQAEIIEAKYRYLVRTECGANAVVSASHHFLTTFDDEKGKPAHVIFNSEHHLVARVRSKRCEIKSHTFKPVFSGKVLRLSVSRPYKYECGITKEAMLESHNKPIIYNIGY